MGQDAEAKLRMRALVRKDAAHDAARGRPGGAKGARGRGRGKGYPVRPARDGAQTPAAFAWTDPRHPFDACGFVVVGNPDGGKQRVRKRIV